SPVLGLRPGRWVFSRRSKLPKPDSFTCSPLSSASRTTSKQASTNSLASRLLRPTSRKSRSAISALVSAISSSQLGLAFPLQCGDGLPHATVCVVVDKRAGSILQNQAHSETFSARFDPLATVAVEQAQLLQHAAERAADDLADPRPGNLFRHFDGDVAAHRGETGHRLCL